MTNHELELKYTDSKSILMEANEPCRIPIPLPRCPLEKFPSFGKEGVYAESQIEMERICSEHIAKLVDLRWTLPATKNTGKASLKGITLAPDMLHIVMVSPLQWGKSITNLPIK